MFTLSTAILALVATASAMPAISSRAADSSSAYKLIADYSGSTFFDHFTNFVGHDPTNGLVNYTDLKTAADKELVGFIYNATSGKSSAYVGVDHTNDAPNGRNSVRLVSRQTFDAGSMAVIDVKHIPVQYGVWPAIWMLGSDGEWPSSGESDILEYVHENTNNAITLHTSPGCTVNNISTNLQQGRLKNADCNAGNAGTGCSVAVYDQSKLPSNKIVATAGSSFNEQGGGVYVHNWQDDGITVWMFPRGQLPADLVAGNPKPATWKQTPLAKFAGNGCNFSKAFRKMSIIINLTFCGDWAGKVWESSGAAEATGVATCNDYVANNPQVFQESYFDIASIRLYSKNVQTPGSGPTFSKRHDDHEEPVQIPNITMPGCDGKNFTLPRQPLPQFLNTTSVSPPEHNCTNGTSSSNSSTSSGQFYGSRPLNFSSPRFPHRNDTHTNNCTTSSPGSSSSSSSTVVSRGDDEPFIWITPLDGATPTFPSSAAAPIPSTVKHGEIWGWSVAGGMFLVLAFVL